MEDALSAASHLRPGRTLCYNADYYRSANYGETQVRGEFLDSFFAALRRDVCSQAGVAPSHYSVILQATVRTPGSNSTMPDYCFRVGPGRKFFVEAKKPAVDIDSAVQSARQLRRYAWTAELPLSILTDFEQFSVYNCRNESQPSDKPATAGMLYVQYRAMPSAGTRSPTSLGMTPCGAATMTATPRRPKASTARKRWTTPFCRRSRAGGAVLAQLAGVPDLDVVLWTHAHEDHIGGLCDVLTAMPVDRVLYNGFDYDSATFNDLVDLINALGLELETVSAGDAFTWGQFDVSVLHPTREYLNTNDSSVVLRLSYGPTDILLTGDIEWDAESDMLARGENLQAEVLKVPHHGSVSSSHAVFLDAVQPEVAIVSVGPNTYGHPSDAVPQRLSNRWIPIYRTDRHGSVILNLTTQDYQVGVSRMPISLPLLFSWSR